jgi:NADPH:quinone reductase-like Zn-dependent oxidoreductase
MKAIRINEWGQPATLEEIAQPTPGPREVLVRVRAASVNKVDWTIAAGYLQGMLTAPMTLGTDFAGDVVAVGAEVTHVQPGDAVYGFIPLTSGSFAEYVVAQSTQVARKPQSLDYSQAAAVPLVATTAWQALFDIAQVQPGERVLIHGAGGGVGGFAVQFAKHAGATVIGTAGADKAARLHELSIDQHVDSQAQPFEEVVRDVDVVFDTVGVDMPARSYGVLKPGGRLVTSAAQITPEDTEAQAARGLRVSGMLAQPNPAQLAQIADLIDAGKVKVSVGQVLPLEQAQEALERVKAQHLPGKVVLNIP